MAEPEFPAARIARALRADRERWALWLPVGFGTGIAVYFTLPAEPATWAGAALLGGIGLVLIALRRRGRDGDGLAYPALVLVVFMAAGFTAAQWRTASVAAPVLAERIGPTAVTGQVVLVETFPRGSRITLERARIAGVSPNRVPERVRVRLMASGPALEPGDWIRARAIVSPPSAPAAPGAFDFQRQSYFQRLGAIGFALGRAEVIAEADEGDWSPALGLARLRRHITERVLAAVDGRTGAVAAALMTGERKAIPPELMDSIRDSGLAHLLAISGLHIGLVAAILFFGVRGALALIPPLALRQPIKKWAAASAVSGAFAYALIAGATVPTQRAFLMVGLVLVAVMVDRRAISIRLVAWAALIILALQPESLLSASFQMSFAAVVALVAAYEAIRDRRQWDRTETRLAPWFRSLGLYAGGVALTTVIAGAATAPFAIYHFNRFADYGLAANMLAVPVTALWAMPWAVASFLLMPFGLEGVALTPMGWGVDAVIAIAEKVSSWPGAVTLVPSIPAPAFALVVIGGLWLCLWRGYWRFAGIASMAAALLVVPLSRAPDILIDGKGRLIAARGADGGFRLSSLNRSRFDRETWLRREGQTDTGRPWPKQGTSIDGRLACDAEGCVYRARGRAVALAFGESALMEDCWMADAVIALVPVRRKCPAPLGVIDRFDLWRDGAHALWIDEERVRILSVNQERGNRPWVRRPAPKKAKEAKAGDRGT